MARQKARVKRVWAILLFFTQFGFIVFTYLGFAEKVICGDREQGTGNREQFQELDGSDFSFASNLNTRFSSSHVIKSCTF
jgi:hypothetical protein